MLLFLGILLIASAPGSHAQLTMGSMTAPVDTSSFVTETESGISGVLEQWDWGTIPQMLTCGIGFTASIFYTIPDQTVDTTLSYAFAIRDATKMPTATLTDLYYTVLNGTAMASVTSDLISAASPIRTGGACNTSRCHYVAGSLDSYGNVIDQGDEIFMDFGLYFTSPADAQNATCTAYASGDTWMVW